MTAVFHCEGNVCTNQTHITELYEVDSIQRKANEPYVPLLLFVPILLTTPTSFPQVRFSGALSEYAAYTDQNLPRPREQQP